MHFLGSLDLMSVPSGDGSAMRKWLHEFRHADGSRVLLELGAEADYLGVVVLEVAEPADLGQVPRECLGRQVARLHGAHELWRCSGSSCERAPVLTVA